jgi:hypothetical protein
MAITNWRRFAMNWADRVSKLEQRLGLREAARSGARQQPEISDGDFRPWLRALFPAFVACDFAPFHEEFWEWVWGIEAGLPARAFVAVWPWADRPKFEAK